MPERDMDKNPYSPDEQRVAQFFFDLGTGGGDDPIGFILASHAYLAAERTELRQKLSEWKQVASVEAGLRREFAALLGDKEDSKASFCCRRGGSCQCTSVEECIFGRTTS